ncbi:unnamed protein product [Anisakis simplex]|uniref:Transmembrane protein n=1 Tax=Anisakis simplex TaxID=6269 RepID=A0A0M3JT44_ANISI|nr:unnamed protein product [Anisakis simplex]
METDVNVECVRIDKLNGSLKSESHRSVAMNKHDRSQTKNRTIYPPKLPSRFTCKTEFSSGSSFHQDDPTLEGHQLAIFIVLYIVAVIAIVMLFEVTMPVLFNPNYPDFN